MTPFLLDANVLIAAVVAEHEHHDRAASWLADVDAFAVCPIVEGALVRFLVRVGESSDTATRLLLGIRNHPRQHFWSDSVSYVDLDLSALRGHRQVSDLYLAGLAAANGGRLATFDAALAVIRPNDTYLVPV